MDMLNKLIGLAISLAMTYFLVLLIGVPLIVGAGQAKSNSWVDSQIEVDIGAMKLRFTPDYINGPRYIRDREWFYSTARCRRVLSAEECANNSHYTLREYINQSRDGLLDRADRLGVSY